LVPVRRGEKNIKMEKYTINKKEEEEEGTKRLEFLQFSW
jgi:hypothetical protein